MISIALTGPVGSGKTTLARQLALQGWQLQSIAAPVKVLGDRVADVFGWERGKAQRRSLYQTLGEAGRTVSEDFWLSHLHLDPEVPTVIDDLRSEFEASYLRDRGFKIVRVVASEERCKKRILERDGPGDQNLGHAMERGWITIEPDLILVNDPDQRLFVSVDSLVKFATSR